MSTTMFVPLADLGPRIRDAMPLAMVASSGLAFASGVALQNAGLLGGGAVALCATLQQWRRCPVPEQPRRCDDAQPPNCLVDLAAAPARPARPSRAAAALSTADLVDQMIDSGRYALLLRPETASHLTPEQWDRVIDAMERHMSIVPEGRVLVGLAAERATWNGASTAATAEGLREVAGFYIDRLAVTNAEFQQFVDAGAYEDFSMWPEEALPALFEFVDQTGEPGPRYWRNGAFARGDERLPVVGISWYEAAAYANWVGKRLLTDAEWTKAAAWPVETTPGRISQRRYPWGDTFECRRANLWTSGAGRPVPVDEYSDGSTLAGVQQLIGNVWEWTSDEFLEGSEAASQHASYRTLHGGAFNTYFENQATCNFRSGEAPLARRNNVGFRLALSLEQLSQAGPDQQ